MNAVECLSQLRSYRERVVRYDFAPPSFFIDTIRRSILSAIDSEIAYLERTIPIVEKWKSPPRRDDSFLDDILKDL